MEITLKVGDKVVDFNGQVYTVMYRIAVSGQVKVFEHSSGDVVYRYPEELTLVPIDIGKEGVEIKPSRFSEIAVGSTVAYRTVDSPNGWNVRELTKTLKLYLTNVSEVFEVRLLGEAPVSEADTLKKLLLTVLGVTAEPKELAELLQRGVYCATAE